MPAAAFGIKSFKLNRTIAIKNNAIKIIITSKTNFANPNCERAIINVTK